MTAASGAGIAWGMNIGAAPPGHYVMGCIHELLPVDGSPEELAELLRHECDECDGARVLVDLTAEPAVDGRHIDVIIETITPEGERWSISLPTDTDPALLRRLREAGYATVEDDPRFRRTG